MSELTRADIDKMVAEATDDRPLLVTRVPEFVDAAERRAWAADYAGELTAAGHIVDDPDEREAAVGVVERAIGLELHLGALLRYLVFASLWDGCAVAEVEVLVDEGDSLEVLIGGNDPTVATAPFERNGVSGVASLVFGLEALDARDVLERAWGIAHAAAHRDLGEWGVLPVRVRCVSSEVVFVAGVPAALEEIVTDADLPHDLAEVLSTLPGAILAQG